MQMPLTRVPSAQLKKKLPAPSFSPQPLTGVRTLLSSLSKFYQSFTGQMVAPRSTEINTCQQLPSDQLSTEATSPPRQDDLPKGFSNIYVLCPIIIVNQNKTFPGHAGEKGPRWAGNGHSKRLQDPSQAWNWPWRVRTWSVIMAIPLTRALQR